MKINPYHVFESIRDKRRIPETTFERALYVKLHGTEALEAAVPLKPWDADTVIDPALEYPWNIFCIPDIRSILEAFLLATNDDFEIHEALHVPLNELGIYRELFFDTSVFRSDLELIVFLRGLPDDADTKKLYRIAFHQGIGALRWNLCRDKGYVEPEAVIKTVMTDSFYRSLEHRGTPLTHKLAKEASNFARMSLECARTLVKDTGVNQADIEDLRIRFEEAKTNRTVHDLNKEMNGEEVMH